MDGSNAPVGRTVGGNDPTRIDDMRDIEDIDGIEDMDDLDDMDAKAPERGDDPPMR